MSHEDSAYGSAIPTPSRPCLSKLLSFFSLTGILTRYKPQFAFSTLDIIQLTRADLSRSIDYFSVLASLYQESLLNLLCFEPEEATQPEARSSAGPEVRRGEGMLGLLTGQVRSAALKDDSELCLDVWSNLS